MFKRVREHLSLQSSPAAGAGHPAGLLAPEAGCNLFPFEEASFLADPYPHYQRLRAQAPLYRSPHGYWVLARYADVLEALGHERLGNRPSRFSTLHGSKAGRYPCANLAANILPFMDGPEHRAQRGALASLFQRRVRAWAPQLFAFVAEGLAALGEEFEVMGDFATPLARGATRSLLGLPDEARLARWSDHFFYLFTKIPSADLRGEIDSSLSEFRQWGQSLLLESGARGLLRDFQGAIQAGTLTEAVAIDSLLLLYADGVQNVDTGIANALHAFARAPEQWQLLCADEQLLRPAVEECLRFDSPAQFVARTVLEDFEWKGQLLKKDQSVFLLLASANRDEEQFEAPDEFRLERTRGMHLSFGKGRHACLGGNLFELELEAVLAALRKRVFTLQLSSPACWQARSGHRWIESARFRITSRG